MGTDPMADRRGRVEWAIRVRDSPPRPHADHQDRPSPMRRFALLLPLMLLAAPTPPAALAQAAARRVDFNRDVKPILSNICFKCHGPDAAERKGGSDGLRLDTPEGATADLG